MSLFKSTILPLCLLLTSTISCAYQNTLDRLQQKALHALNEKAEHFTTLVNGNRYEVNLSATPENLRLSPCPHTISTEIITDAPAGSQRLQLRCPDQSGWSIFLRGQIDIFTNVLVSRQVLTKDEIPTSGNTLLEERNISNLKRGYLLDYQQLQNQVMARRLQAGEVITPAMLAPEQIIQRGDYINLVARGTNSNSGNKAFSISTPGEALSNGALNQQVRVRNISSGRVLRGTVLNRTEVLVQ